MTDPIIGRPGSLSRRYGPMPLLRLPRADSGHPSATPAAGGRATVRPGLLSTLSRIVRLQRLPATLLAGASAAIVLNAVITLIAPFLLGLAIDVLIGQRRDGPSAATLLAWLVSLYVAQSGASMLQAVWLTRLAQQLVSRIRQQVFAHLHRLPIPSLQARSPADVVSRLTNDLENMSLTIGQVLPKTITGLIVFAGMLAMMAWLSPILTAIAVLLVPAMVASTRWITARSSVLAKRQQARLGELSGFVDENLGLAALSRLYGRGADTLARFDEHNAALTRSAYWAQTYAGFLPKVMYLSDNLGFSLVVVIGATLAVQSDMTIGTMVTFAEYIRHFARQLNQISTQIGTVYAAAAGAERTLELLDDEPESEGGRPLPAMRGHVSFRHVGFGYLPGQPVLHDLSFDIPAGTTLALVGPTGSGKSTVVQLLTRIHDVDAGSVEIDGHDVRTLARGSLRRRMAFVLQEPMLFDMSIAENVRFSRPEATDAQIESACRLANAHEFVTKLPDGYQTVIGDRAHPLSHGQRQLLTIARAILADPAILILDEATSSVDALTEHQIQLAMRRLMRDRTCLVIAHRLNIIRGAHQIVVLDHGRVVERGTHRSLLDADGLYAALYRSQTSTRFDDDRRRRPVHR